MVTSRYKTRVSPASVARKLRAVCPAIEAEAQAIIDEAAAVGTRVASENCPADQITFTTKQYESDTFGGGGRAVSIIAKGPKIHHKKTRWSGSYSFPLVKALEYGTGRYGARDTVDNGRNHGYVPNLSGKGDKGWYYETNSATGEKKFTHGVWPRHFMHKGAEAMRTHITQYARQSAKKRLLVAQIKKRSGLK